MFNAAVATCVAIAVDINCNFAVNPTTYRGKVVCAWIEKILCKQLLKSMYIYTFHNDVSAASAPLDCHKRTISDMCISKTAA